MSVISNRHTITPFTSGKSQPLTGQRLAKITYKSSTDKKTGVVTLAKYPSQCVSLPIIATADLVSNIDKLADFLREHLQDAQRDIIKGLWESSNGTLASVGDEEVDIAACIAFINSRGNVDKESAIEWFDSQVKENLTVVIADKLGFTELNEDQMKTINQQLNGYRALFGVVGANRQKLNPQQISGVRAALRIAGEDDKVSRTISARLDTMEKPEPMVELLDLG